MCRKTSASNLQSEKLENRSVKDKVHILYNRVIDGFSLNMFSSMQLCVGLSHFPAEQPSGWMTVQVPASIGLQYAHVTGDYFPHHLYPWTARLLGYSNPMAHEMWTLQRALQCVKGRPTHHGLLGVSVCVRACVHVCACRRLVSKDMSAMYVCSYHVCIVCSVCVLYIQMYILMHQCAHVRACVQ